MKHVVAPGISRSGCARATPLSAITYKGSITSVMARLSSPEWKEKLLLNLWPTLCV